VLNSERGEGKRSAMTLARTEEKNGEWRRGPGAVHAKERGVGGVWQARHGGGCGGGWRGQRRGYEGGSGRSGGTTARAGWKQGRERVGRSGEKKEDGLGPIE
jgi:hypothetical protein